MKVFMLVNCYPDNDFPNSYIWVHNLVKALLNRNIQVSVLLYDVRAFIRKRRYGLSMYKYEGVKVYRWAFPLGPFPKISRKLMEKNICSLYEYAVQCDGSSPDLLHAHFSDAGYGASIIKQKYHIPYVLTEHSSGLFEIPYSKEMVYVHKRAYKCADKLFAVSSPLKRTMNQSFTNKEIMVMPNGIPDYFCLKNIKKQKKFTFITVANLIPRKRIDLLLRAFAEMSRRVKNIQLWLVGEGEEKNALIKYCDKLGITSNVKFKGKFRNDEMPDIYNQCHCFVLLSENETFGVVYAEAAFCGLPVIATKCGGPEDIVDSHIGKLIPTGDCRAAYDAMYDIYEHYLDYKPEEIYRRMKQKFSEENLCQNLVKEYQKVISN